MQVADIAKEIAIFAKMGDTTDHHDQDAVWRCFQQMVQTDAKDMKDVLALLASARTILNAYAPPVGTLERDCQHCALLLIRNAIAAMEQLSGEREATYTGREWN